MSLSSKEIKKLLKQAQTGDLAPILSIRASNPDFHWSTLKYPDTGDTILHCSSRLGLLSTSEYLLTFKPSGVDCKNNDDKTPLHEAAQFSQLESVELLLKNGAQVNALKRADWTPLMLACTKDNVKIVKLLVDKGAIINYQNKDGWTALHLAARLGSLKIVKVLIDSCGDFSVRTKNGRSVLHVACLHGNFEVVRFLVEVGSVVNSSDNCGNTPLHDAVLSRNVELCEFLVDSGADIYCRNSADFNLVMLAASVGYNDVVLFLLNCLKFDINYSNVSGFTALHCAARKKQIDTFNLLVSLGIKENTTDKFGRTARDYLR